MTRRLSLSALGIKYTYIVNDSTENEVLQQLILRGTLCYSHRGSYWYSLTLCMKLKRSKENSSTHISSLLCTKLVIRNCWGWVCHVGRHRLQIISPIPRRTSSRHPPPGSFQTLAQDSLGLPQDHVFVLFLQHDRRLAAFCLGLASPCFQFSLWKTLRSLDNMPACEPNKLWRDNPKAVGVTITLVTSQMMASPGCKRMSREETTDDVTGKFHILHANCLYLDRLVSEVPFPGVSILTQEIALVIHSFQS